MEKLLAAFLASALVSLSACAQETPAPGAGGNRSVENATHLITRFQVAEENLDAFLDLMTNINAAMASEEGFIAAEVYRNSDDPLAFTLIEGWETRALHDEHFQRIYASGDWAALVAMLTKYPEMSYNTALRT